MNRLAWSSRIALGLALVWAAGLIVAAFVVPVYSPAGSLVAVNGLWALIPVSTPLAVALGVAVILAGRRRRGRPGAGPFAWSLAAVACLVSFLGMLTIGLVLLPVAVLLIVACAIAENVSQVPGPEGNRAVAGEPAHFHRQ
jgi:hypothetical protein